MGEPREEQTDDLDRAMDRALRLLAAPDAEPGLRERVLARLASQGKPSAGARRPVLWYGLASAVGVALLGFLLILWQLVPATGPSERRLPLPAPPVAGESTLSVATAPAPPPPGVMSRRPPKPRPPGVAAEVVTRLALATADGGPDLEPPLPEPPPVVVEALAIEALEFAPLEVPLPPLAGFEGERKP